jgi:RNA polymerase primary sigma factor
MSYRSNLSQSVIITATNRSLLDKYYQEISKLKPLSREDEVHLFNLIIKNNDQSAIDKICKHNLLFVAREARRYISKLGHSKTLYLEDLINEGNIGLCEAIKRFDPDKGHKFITYAVWWIRLYILKSIQDNVKSIRLPTSVKHKIDDINKIKNRMEHEGSIEVSLREVYEEMRRNGDVKQCESYGKFIHNYNLGSFEESINDFIGGEKEDGEFAQLIPDETTMNGEELLIDREKKDLIYNMLNDLDDNRLLYIKHFFGLDDFEKLTVKEIADKYNKPEANLRYDIKKSISNLKKKNKLKLREFT